MDLPIYPWLLAPCYRDYVWGGRRMAELFGRPLPPHARAAESWEAADRPDGQSTVDQGPLAGATLRDLMLAAPEAILGPGAADAPFPLLVKIIDARERLSLQVHPGRRSVLGHGGEPKTEMWVVLDAPPGARVFAGLRPGTTPSALRTAISDGSAESLLKAYPVARGDAVFIPGGRLHAIGEGCLMLEVQQNSDTTYRLFDWGRLGADGKPRPLHLEQALATMDWEDAGSPIVRPSRPVSCGSGTVEDLVMCDEFRVQRIRLSEAGSAEQGGGTCQVLFAARAPLTVTWPGGTVEVPFGRTCLVPATLRTWAIRTGAPGAEIIRAMPG